MRGHLFPAIFTKAKSYVGRRITLFKDCDQKACPLRKGFAHLNSGHAGFFEDFGVALYVFGGKEWLGDELTRAGVMKRMP